MAPCPQTDAQVGAAPSRQIPPRLNASAKRADRGSRVRSGTRPGPRPAGRFYLRLLAVGVISAAACTALWPSVSGFAAGRGPPDRLRRDQGRLARRPVGPERARTWSAILATYPAPPTEAERSDPAWHGPIPCAVASRRKLPRRAAGEVAYEEWVGGAGQCVRESRHRLILSGLGLGGLGLILGGIALVRRTRTSLRRYARGSRDEPDAGSVRKELVRRLRAARGRRRRRTGAATSTSPGPRSGGCAPG